MTVALDSAKHLLRMHRMHAIVEIQSYLRRAMVQVVEPQTVPASDSRRSESCDVPAGSADGSFQGGSTSEAASETTDSKSPVLQQIQAPKISQPPANLWEDQPMKPLAQADLSVHSNETQQDGVRNSGTLTQQQQQLQQQIQQLQHLQRQHQMQQPFQLHQTHNSNPIIPNVSQAQSSQGYVQPPQLLAPPLHRPVAAPSLQQSQMEEQRNQLLQLQRQHQLVMERHLLNAQRMASSSSSSAQPRHQLTQVSQAKYFATPTSTCGDLAPYMVTREVLPDFRGISPTSTMGNIDKIEDIEASEFPADEVVDLDGLLSFKSSTCPDLSRLDFAQVSMSRGILPTMEEEEPTSSAALSTSLKQFQQERARQLEELQHLQSRSRLSSKSSVTDAEVHQVNDLYAQVARLQNEVKSMPVLPQAFQAPAVYGQDASFHEGVKTMPALPQMLDITDMAFASQVLSELQKFQM